MDLIFETESSTSVPVYLCIPVLILCTAYTLQIKLHTGGMWRRRNKERMNERKRITECGHDEQFGKEGREEGRQDGELPVPSRIRFGQENLLF